MKLTKQAGEQPALKGEKRAVRAALITVGIFIAIAWADWLIISSSGLDRAAVSDGLREHIYACVSENARRITLIGKWPG